MLPAQGCNKPHRRAPADRVRRRLRPHRQALPAQAQVCTIAARSAFGEGVADGHFAGPWVC